MRVLGVDGARGQWAIADVEAHGGRVTSVSFRRCADLAPELADAGVATIGIDMPIGLPRSSARAADLEARHRLRPHGSRVFAAPVRAVLGAADFADANAISRLARGVGISLQTWHLVPHIAALDPLARRDPRLIEVHPELSFAALTGTPIDASKKTKSGRAARIAALRDWAGELTELPPGDDHLDAVAAAWSALRYASKQAIELGGGERDDVGLPMRIVV